MLEKTWNILPKTFETTKKYFAPFLSIRILQHFFLMKKLLLTHTCDKNQCLYFRINLITRQANKKYLVFSPTHKYYYPSIPWFILTWQGFQSSCLLIGTFNHKSIIRQDVKSVNELISKCLSCCTACMHN